jgi:hypothetical protein
MQAPGAVLDEEGDVAGDQATLLTKSFEVASRFRSEEEEQLAEQGLEETIE